MKSRLHRLSLPQRRIPDYPQQTTTSPIKDHSESTLSSPKILKLLQTSRILIKQQQQESSGLVALQNDPYLDHVEKTSRYKDYQFKKAHLNMQEVVKTIQEQGPQLLRLFISSDNQPTGGDSATGVDDTVMAKEQIFNKQREILPSLVSQYNTEQQKILKQRYQITPQNIAIKKPKIELPPQVVDTDVKKILLKKCGQKESYLLYKRRHESVLEPIMRTRKQEIQFDQKKLFSSSPPKEIKLLRDNLLSRSLKQESFLPALQPRHLKLSNVHRRHRTEISTQDDEGVRHSPVIDGLVKVENILQSSARVLQIRMPMKKIKRLSTLQEKELLDIKKNYDIVFKNKFPEAPLSSMIGQLQRLDSRVYKEIEKQAVSEEKSKMSKKFEDMLKDEVQRKKAHLKQMMDYRIKQRRS